MLLTLDTLGSRYGLLPSEVLVRANTLDLAVMDAAVSYEHFMQKKESGEYAGNHSEDELMKIMNEARGRRG